MDNGAGGTTLLQDFMSVTILFSNFIVLLSGEKTVFSPCCFSSYSSVHLFSPPFSLSSRAHSSSVILMFVFITFAATSISSCLTALCGEIRCQLQYFFFSFSCFDISIIKLVCLWHSVLRSFLLFSSKHYHRTVSLAPSVPSITSFPIIFIRCPPG